MTLNFFTPEQGFQKNLFDPSPQVGPKKDYTTNLKKDEFKTSHSGRSDGKHNPSETEQNEKFSDIMEALKKKESAQRKDTVQKPKEADAQNNESMEVSKLHIGDILKNIEKSVFHTNESALPVQLNNIETGSIEQNMQVSQAYTAALEAEIQHIIEEQTHKNDTENQILLATESEVEEVEGIFALLASLLSSKEDDDKKSISTDNGFSFILEKIQEIAESNDAPAITSGLTPQQVTQLQANVENLINDELDQSDQEALEALVTQFLSLSAPTKNIEHVTRVTAENVTQDTKATKDTLQSALQAIPEKSLGPVQKEHYAQSRYDSRYDAKFNGGENRPPSDTNDAELRDFKSLLKETNVKSGDNATTAAVKDNMPSAGQRFLQAANLGQGTPSSFDMTNQQSGGLTTTQNAQTLLQSSITQVTTQSHTSAQTHPATQLVSATIQKAIKAGEDTNIKLKLDPPELGRVEVKMSIDKDSATKIILTAEKPETYMLLKQDAGILERALSNAGLDTDNGLSFELASENENFEHDGRQGNEEKTGKHAQSDENDKNLIETTMDWQVDPKTGRMHYNVLV